MLEVVKRPVRIHDHWVVLPGELAVPKGARGLVVFAHGSGSSRHSPRNRFVAERLQQTGAATLLFDLLTAEEEREDRETAEFRFNIPLLTERLLQAIAWCRQQKELAALRLGIFGASTGAAAALAAAAELGEEVDAVVSRGGRPDLATGALGRVKAPTLLIVGEWDELVLELNEQALQQLSCERKLVVIPGASHLFEEPGALEQVAELAAQWFSSHWKTAVCSEERHDCPG
ncbi:dienelactone hydrolase family protein [Candidatus Methylacidithermus pantelleriae]|uniref:Predicted phosphoribosyltransferase n=1 Tax=Candidatus Methylacidithermus pantelleriae TaxID=2744239 RepID=A0A8J2BKQ9_9BACT|nr:alpha/beta family hydrolase [Candidatus Methylacidithermus pantelleriae]CAF0694029.1 Predicted phosphoribosyltransferase [Candidatus Methylacidithermus pantelleriae]